MPTKARRLREQQRAVDRLVLDHVPEHARNDEAESINADLRSPALPGGGLTTVDEAGDVGLHPDIGQNRKRGWGGANQDRQDEATMAAKKLKAKYREIWGKRSAAKRIAIETNQTAETIRKYFKRVP